MAKSKRSSTARIALMGAAAFTLAACEPEEKVDTAVFPTLGSCLDAALQVSAEFTAEDCEASFAKAEEAHKETAPRYAEGALCEEQHGGQCNYVAPASGGGSGFFMPMMMGYMMGNMMSGDSGRSYSAQPLYKTKSGKYATASGSTILNSNKGFTKLRQSSFKAAPSAAKAAPMTRASIKKSGGFGASRTSTRGFGGSRGG